MTEYEESKSLTSGQQTPSPKRLKKSYREPKGREFALQIVVAQVLLTGVLSLLGLLIGHQSLGHQIAFAILCGGIISSLANLWLAVIAFRPALGKSPEQMLTAFYVGEVGKFIITAALFLIVFKKSVILKEPRFAFLMFAAFLMVQFTIWIYPLVRNKTIATLAKFNHR